ncbi:hypothetical protein Y032_0134g1878 [Ancylostoma ceylanicum]|uniref:Uncharacterized protein n=1 Tax=Ancylostoma ceylanicum TaxID=53326 RepID=A0A016T5A5_9BILA|nr:hypothetical protein Y032_0134g1878 [Ancylostoma ceylanicum]
MVRPDFKTFPNARFDLITSLHFHPVDLYPCRIFANFEHRTKSRSKCDLLMLELHFIGGIRFDHLIMYSTTFGDNVGYYYSAN